MAIYDCFIFYNELDLLELRFRTLYDLVDYFVIVEAPKTLTGYDKPCFYEENISRYRQYSDKIVHVKVNDMPVKSPQVPGPGGLWDNEIFQRDCIMRGLNNCDPDDIIIISDLDEIPRRKIIQNLDKPQRIRFFHMNYSRSDIVYQLKYHLREERSLFRNLLKIRNLSQLLDYTPVAITGEMFYYFMNWRVDDVWACTGPIICKYKNITTPHQMRSLKDWIPFIYKADYHFSYLGGIENVLLKIQNASDYRKRDFTVEMFETALEQGVDIMYNKTITKMDISYFDKPIRDFIMEHPSLYRE